MPYFGAVPVGQPVHVVGLPRLILPGAVQPDFQALLHRQCRIRPAGDPAPRHRHARRWAVLRHSAFGQVHVDVLAREDRRLHAVRRRPRLHEAHRRLDRFLHHFAELAGRLDLALAGDGDRLDRQQLAADLGPGEAGDGADLVLFLADPVAELPDAEEFAQVVGRQLDLLDLVFEDLPEGFARHLAIAADRAGIPVTIG